MSETKNILSVLGPPGLKNAEGADVRSVLAQPRRFALLVYVAVEGLTAAVGRDRILALFWPEADPQKARASLRRSLHFLRQSLGPEAVASAAGDRLVASEDTLALDAAVFLTAIGDGRYSDALDAYAGNFLEGFHTSDAPGFEHWCDQQRSRFNKLAADAAWSLSEEAEEAGHAGLAVHHAKTAARLEASGPSFRRFLETAERCSDPEGAILAFEEHAERLRRDYETTPAAETLALVERIRATVQTEDGPPSPPLSTSSRTADPGTTTGLGGGPDPTSPTAPAAAPTGVLATPDPGLTTPAAAIEPRHRWRTWGGAAVVIALVGALGVILAQWRNATPALELSQNLAIVFPFSYEGTDTLEFSGPGMVRLLSAGLNGATDLRTVDPRAVHARVADATPPFLPGNAREMAHQFGAGLMVLGDIVENGGTVRITASLYSVGGRGATVVREATVNGRADEILALADSLTGRLLLDRMPSQFSHAALGGTASIEAWKSFLSGEAAFSEGRFSEAIDHFSAAAQVDTNFALAHYRLSEAADWVGQSNLAVASAERAVAASSRLPTADSLVVSAWRLNLDRNINDAERLYERAISFRQSFVEAHWQLGEMRYHWSSILGQGVEQAAPQFEEVIGLEPNNVPARIHLGRIAARRGDDDEVGRLASEAEQLRADPDLVLELRILEALAGSEATELAVLIERLKAASAATQAQVMANVLPHTTNLPDLAAILAELLEADLAPREAARLRLRLWETQVAMGRLEAATRVLAEATELPHSRRAELRAATAVLPFVPSASLDQGMVEAYRAVGGTYPARSEAGGSGRIENEFPGLWWNGALASLQGFLLALIDGKATGSPPAWHPAQEPLRPQEQEHLTGLKRITDARRALAEGRPEDGLATLGPPTIIGRQTYETFTSYERPYARFLRADLLAGAGRLQEALAWYRTFPDHTGHDLAYVAPARLRSAAILSELGNTAAAEAAYEEASILWSDADPELKAQLEAGRPTLP